MLYLTDGEIERLVTVSEVVESLRQVFTQLDEQTASVVPRTRVNAKSGMLDMMGAVSDVWDLAAVKSYYINDGVLNFHLVLFAAREAEPVAIMQARKLGQLRTGAASGLATDILSIRNAKTMGCIGTGYQAEAQVDAVISVRPIETILIHSRKTENMKKFGKLIRERHDVDVIELDNVFPGFAEADVISCATDSTIPVLGIKSMGHQCHINAVGGYRPDMVEVEPDLISSCMTVVADLKKQAMNESGELISAVESGKLSWDEVDEMKDINAGRVHRRSNASTECTFFKSLGVAVEDLAAAKIVYDAALSRGAGREL